MRLILFVFKIRCLRFLFFLSTPKILYFLPGLAGAIPLRPAKIKFLPGDKPHNSRKIRS